MALLSFFVSTPVPVFARYISGYNVTLPRWGSRETGNLLKVNYTCGINNNSSIGGGKKLYTAIRHAYRGSDVTETSAIGSRERVRLRYRGGAQPYVGARTTLAISSGTTTWVRVECSGSWSPDER